jgi:hypothetical protein
MNQAFTIPAAAVVTYAPTDLQSFFAYGFEWIDNFHFLREPSIFLGDKAREYECAAAARFKEVGWAGDGDVNLLWLPPFVFPLELRIAPEGVVLWHVKQQEDGVSYLLSPIPLPFPEFEGSTQP